MKGRSEERPFGVPTHRPDPSGMPHPGPLKRAVFALVLAAIPLVSIEALLQLYYRLDNGGWLFVRSYPRIYAPDADRCFALRPGLAYRQSTSEFSIDVYTNRQGFRTDSARRDVPEEKRPGVARVLFLGPSFTFGWGVDHEDSYVGMLERRLGRGGAAEVINAGVPAQPSAMQLCWLAASGRRLRPDVVVQTVYYSVDNFQSACDPDLPCPVVRDGVLHSAGSASLRARLTGHLRNSALAFYTWYFYQLAVRGESEAGTGRELYPEEPAGDVDVEAVVERYAAYRRFVRRALGPDTRVVFVYIPLTYVVHPEDVRRWSHLGIRDAAEERALVSRVAAELRGRGIPFVDTTGPLVASASGGRLYYWLDIHMTPRGNRVVADAAEAEVRRAIAGGGRERPRARARGSGASIGQVAGGRFELPTSRL